MPGPPPYPPWLPFHLRPPSPSLERVAHLSWSSHLSPGHPLCRHAGRPRGVADPYVPLSFPLLLVVKTSASNFLALSSRFPLITVDSGATCCRAAAGVRTRRRGDDSSTQWTRTRCSFLRFRPNRRRGHRARPRAPGPARGVLDLQTAVRAMGRRCEREPVNSQRNVDRDRLPR